MDSHFTGRSNIGLLLGAPSGGLIDVDIDSVEALAAADIFLPATALIHGRGSKLRSHRYYQVKEALHTKKFSDVDGTMLIELRLTASQTIVPPSAHPSGEPIVWEDDGAPNAVGGAALFRQIALTATSAILARHWPGE